MLIRKFFKVFFPTVIVVLILVGVFCAGYWYGTNVKLQIPNEKLQLKIQNLTPTQGLIPTLDPIADWKTFNSAINNYLLQYPSGWKLSDCSNEPCEGAQNIIRGVLHMTG